MEMCFCLSPECAKIFCKHVNLIFFFREAVAPKVISFEQTEIYFVLSLLLCAHVDNLLSHSSFTHLSFLSVPALYFSAFWLIYLSSDC